MLVQTVVLISAMVVLAGTILSGGLVTARAAEHQAMLSRIYVAMSDAKGAFVASTQSFVQKYGTEQQVWPVHRTQLQPLCSGDDGRPYTVNGSRCGYFESLSWAVTGTSAKRVNSGSSPGVAVANYLANTVDEQRVSATVAVQISDATGDILYGERSQEITARVFSAPPYVVITGVRDVGAQAGGFRASEGDTGGALAQTANTYVSRSPNPSFPAAYTDTRILTTIDCVNSLPTTGAAIPKAFFDSRFHRYGEHIWAYESSCTSGSYATIGAPIDYVPSASVEFLATPQVPNTPWNTGADDTGQFPR